VREAGAVPKDGLVKDRHGRPWRDEKQVEVRIAAAAVREPREVDPGDAVSQAALEMPAEEAGEGEARPRRRLAQLEVSDGDQRDVVGMDGWGVAVSILSTLLLLLR
jgi:hypothetical protein